MNQKKAFKKVRGIKAWYIPVTGEGAFENRGISFEPKTEEGTAIPIKICKGIFLYKNLDPQVVTMHISSCPELYSSITMFVPGALEIANAIDANGVDLCLFKIKIQKVIEGVPYAVELEDNESQGPGLKIDEEPIYFYESK